VDEGGIVSYELGYPWFEEYPARPLQHVLNGMIFAMVGLSDLLAVAPHSDAGQFWHQGLASLEARIERFDTGRWSAYDVSDDFEPRIASMAYHSLHIAQLQALGRHAGRTVFSQIAERFADYARNPGYRLSAGIALFRAKRRSA
jgi:heparosan-N-sulfate-glucuronate 5-epimerase